ncbi:MAG: N-acetylmuramoyl-L-alanine amidase [Clostridia bacterium]|nr:N-acetylmuramoyl-L-alanine amidase [Clostridia bacterium]
MKRLLATLLVLLLLLQTAIVSVADNSIRIYFMGKQITSDVEPYIENSRTMVPVRMITEKMGYDVLWNPVTRMVTIYSPEKRVVLTIDNAIARIGDDTVRMDTPAVIRQDRTFVPIRFVSENFGYDVDWDNDTRSVLITKPQPTPTPTPIPTIKPVTTPKPTNKPVSDNGTIQEEDDIIIDKIFTERTANKLYLKIQTDKGRVENYHTMTLDNPLRYVVDIPDAVLHTDINELKVGSEYISKVRFSQYTVEPNSVRIVMDLNKDTKVEFGYDSGFFVISLTDSPSSIKKIAGAKKTDSDVITITSNTVLASDPFVLYNPYRIVFDFYNTACSANALTFRGNFVEKIQFYEHSDKTRITITAKENAQYTYRADGTSYNITVTKPIPTVTPAPGNTPSQAKYKKLIVLDPGHGGTEPGTLGKINGEVVIQEKELNLKISNKVLKILRDKGYNVIATRTTDTYVGLTTRADIANSAKADLFVSIHNNSFTDPSAKGTLTMYAYDDAKDNRNISGKTIAGIMQKELVKGTGGYDRGLLKNPQIVVIRKTEMPAILTECLFMSNPEDMAELLKESRLDNIAAHIAQGIINIVDKMVEVDSASASRLSSPSPSSAPTATP